MSCSSQEFAKKICKKVEKMNDISHLRLFELCVKWGYEKLSGTVIWEKSFAG